MKKLRDALERAKNQIENCFPVIDPEADGCTDPFEWAEIISVRVRSITANLDEALSDIAELEKPGEEAEAAWKKLLDHFSANNWRLNEDVCLEIFQSFAASYHTKKCAECSRIPPKCVLCGDPIIVGVCENCVPDIIKNG